jgi:hypothetical protein
MQNILEQFPSAPSFHLNAKDISDIKEDKNRNSQLQTICYEFTSMSMNISRNVIGHH